MDVEADKAVVGLCHPVHRLIGERERRMSAEHGGNHAGVLLGCPLREVDVLLDGLVELLLAVALRCLIAEAGTDAELLAHILDCKEGARNLGEACMMVEDRRDTVLQALQDGSLGRGLRLLHIELAVNRPPLLLEVLEEVRRIAALDCKAAGKPRIDMGMAVHKARHDEATMGIDEFCLGVRCSELCSRADSGDCLPVDQHSAIFEIRKFGRAGDKAPISNQ